MAKRSTIPVVMTIVAAAFVVIMAWSLRTFGRYQPYTGFFGGGASITRNYAIVLDDVAIRGRQGGRPIWSVRTKRMTLSLDRSNLIADGISDGAVYRDAIPVARFVADRATYSSGVITPENGSLDVVGNIRISSEGAVKPFGGHFTIASSRGIWNGYTSVLLCPELVRTSFTTASEARPTNVEAESLSWDSHANTLTCSSQVTASVPLPNLPGTMTIRSTDLVLDRNSETIRANGPSRVVCPMPASSNSVSIEAQKATWYQKTAALVCDAPVSAALVMPGTNTPVTVTALNAVWMPHTGHLTSPQGIHAGIGTLGQLDCGAVDVDTRARAVSFGLIRLAANSSDVAAMGEATSPPTAKKDSPPVTTADDHKVHVLAPEGGHWDEQNRTLELHGPVTFTQDDATLTTIGAIYDRKSQSAKALSPVTVTDPENTLTGEHGDIDFRKKIINITGNVHLVAKPKEDAPTTTTKDESFDTTKGQGAELFCDKLVYDYRAKLADASGHLTIKQPKRTITALVGHYNATTKIVDLVGDVVGKDEGGKLLEAPTAKASMKKGDEWIDFPTKIKAEFTIDDDENAPKPKPDTKGKDPATTPKVTPPK